VVATHRFDGSFEAHADLCFVDLDTTQSLANLVELALGSSASPAQIVEALGDGAHFVALPPADVDQLGVSSLDRVAVTLHQLGEVLDRLDRSFQLMPPVRGVEACFRIRFEPALRVAQPPFQELLALVQTGVADLQILAATDQDTGPRVDLGTPFTACLGSRRLSSFIGLQGGEQRFQLGDSGSLAIEPFRGSENAVLDGLHLCCGVATFVLGA
jgi:hypothetical protein